MNREEKAAVIDEVAGDIGSAQAIFAIDYRGITVAQVADLRARLRESSTKLRVVKNSLSERAADQAGAPELKPMLVGPTALAFVQGDAAQAAKTLSDMSRALRLLEFKGGLLNGTALTAADVQSIARLPARDVLNAQFVGTIAAPLSGLVRTLNALIAGLAIQLGAIADQGLVGGGAGAPAAAETATEKRGAAASEEPAATATEEPEAPAPEPEAGAEEPEPQAPEPEASPTEQPEAAEEPEAAPDEPPAPLPPGAQAEQTEGTSDDGPTDES